MLTLPIKKKWFDMILSGEKKEEYRDIKPYWTKRFSKAFDIDEEILLMEIERATNHDLGVCYQHKILVKYINGYGTRRPYFIAKIQLHIGHGKQKWGAEPGKKYYVLRIMEIKE